MDITIHAAFLPHDDPAAALVFYRDTLGLEVRNNVEQGGLHWITVGPADQSATAIVLHPPAVPTSSKNRPTSSGVYGTAPSVTPPAT